MKCRSRITAAILTACLAIALCPASRAVEVVTFRRNSAEKHVTGKVLVTAKDGGIMLLAPDGMLYNIEPQELVSHERDDRDFKPMTLAEAGKATLAQLPAGFEVYTTAHYVIVHNTSRPYAVWVGSLYERLYSAFHTYWKTRGFELHDSELPLVVCVFSTKEAYTKLCADELGQNANAIIGFYSFRTNRVNMYDLTGIESLRRPGDHRSSTAQINQMLARPEAETMVATIIHEATHQIAFNCGMQTRFSDVPLWLLEGMAVYFETPDLNSAKGWRTIGEVNRPRLDRFRDYLPHRPSKSLLSLISDDKRFRDPRQALDAYAEAWALNYYLIHQKPKEYLAYIQAMSTKKTLIFEKPEKRVQQFQEAFGDDLEKLDGEFVKFVQKIK